MYVCVFVCIRDLLQPGMMSFSCNGHMCYQCVPMFVRACEKQYEKPARNNGHCRNNSYYDNCLNKWGSNIKSIVL